MFDGLSSDVRELVRQAQQAYDERDAKALIDIGGELERKRAFGLAWPLLADAPLIKREPNFPEWDGKPFPGGTLLVRKRIRHLGAELRMARFIASASAHIPRTVVATENRLVDLLARSFPEAEVIAKDALPLLTGEVREASYERLAQFFGADETTIRKSWRPLKALPATHPPVGTHLVRIGIAWHSSNARKALPELADWCRFLTHKDVQFVSLQYHELEAGIEQLASGTRHPLLPSAPIDQIEDVDGFASQVASVAGVLTISNTTAHMAGALGVPCVVLLDDIKHLTWPDDTDRTPFYPYLRFVRRQGRRWPDVLDQAFSDMLAMVQHEDGR